MSTEHTPSLYTIPSGIPFLDTLAGGLMERSNGDPATLAHMLVLLPTRRACRALRESFLRHSEGRPLLLPRMQPLGDIDAGEFIPPAIMETAQDIPPAMQPLRRQILLARAIAALPDFTRGPAQDMALAETLGRLMDRVHTEGLNLKDLPGLVDTERFASHWQITVDFLTILSEHWPRILCENGMIDAADRRVRVIQALTAHWNVRAPGYPVIAAGSTGSIPATANLLKTIAFIPDGYVVLPGLDTDMDAESWKAVTEGHPQATLKQLLKRMGCTRTNVQIWPHSSGTQERNNAARRFLATETMRPAPAAAAWQSLSPPENIRRTLPESIKDIRRYDCGTSQEEALLIALLMRETLETPGKTAALVTPDRNLARRVTAACRRWNLDIDDSGGHPLTTTPAGTYIKLCAETCRDNLRPGKLMALLKHNLCKNGPVGIESARTLEQSLLRGPSPRPGIDGLRRRIAEKRTDMNNTAIQQVETLVETLEPLMKSLLAMMKDKNICPFPEFLDAHIALCESLAGGPDNLWQDEDGEAAAKFLSDLRRHAKLIPDCTAGDYTGILNRLMESVTVRPTWGTHPRLIILGQLEARLVQADRIILAGLNEGTWPPDPGTDPWMSRPMRAAFGLPAAERAVGQAAHDFVQGFCAGEVFLTRSQRINGAPSVPARWLQRLDTVLQALDIPPETLTNGPHRNWLETLDRTKDVRPCQRPDPRPPLSDRPRRLSVTGIEEWLRDPYALYARNILRLKKLEELEKSVDVAERGTLLHDILENFSREYPDRLPDDAEARLIAIARKIIDRRSDDPHVWSLWFPRFLRIASWLIRHETEWRTPGTSIHTEARGAIELRGPGGTFTLTARADRIDTRPDGSASIIDYKSGGTYSSKALREAALPQLPLEAAILHSRGFENIPAHTVENLSYWILTGGREAGKITILEGSEAVTQASETAVKGLENLIRIFDNENTPYYSVPRLDRPPRFSDYTHLARIQEWAAPGESEDAA